MKNGFIIAGTNSGCGKTTITIGLMQLLSNRGYKVAPFKTGPDYIDPAFHSLATQSPSHNLDSYMLGNETLQTLFGKYNQGDIAVIEGVMGMYDGLGNEASGSTAELAKILDLPVILVVNCKALYQSVAAIINGFVQFDKSVKVAGVILNNVYSDKQFAFLQQYVEQHCQIPCFGYLPPDPVIVLGSRHLGLIQAGEIATLKDKINHIANLLEQHCDINRILETTRVNPPLQSHSKAIPSANLKGLRIGVARDKAFSFYYQANLDLLTENGAELFFFSPLNDTKLPENINALYLGGGYPEVFAAVLSNNTSMRESIRQAAEAGMPVYGECGGLMYLTEAISPSADEWYPMCGVFNCRAQMTSRLQHFGYCHVDWDGVVSKAHEFHHSQLLENENPNYTKEFAMQKTEIEQQWQGGLHRKNVLAGYPHLHFYSNTDFYNKLMKNWLDRCD